MHSFLTFRVEMWHWMSYFMNVMLQLLKTQMTRGVSVLTKAFILRPSFINKRTAYDGSSLKSCLGCGVTLKVMFIPLNEIKFSYKFLSSNIHHLSSVLLRVQDDSGSSFCPLVELCCFCSWQYAAFLLCWLMFWQIAYPFVHHLTAAFFVSFLRLSNLLMCHVFVLINYFSWTL